MKQSASSGGRRRKTGLAALTAAGFEKIPSHTLDTFGRRPEGIYGLAGESAWVAFMQQGREALGAAGWQIEYPDDFRHHVLEVEGWEADLVESEGGWFDLDMGIIVEGERLALAPLLATLFRHDGRWLEGALLAQIADDEPVELQTPRRQRIRVPASRIKPLAATLIDLFDNFTGGSTLRVSRFDAPRLAELNDTSRWQFRGQHDILFADQLRAAQGIARIESPAGLRLELRPYQKEGLAWLQFLRRHNLSGVLADDMGLGKTVQALALCCSRRAGRLAPALIVAPTSVVSTGSASSRASRPRCASRVSHGAIAREPLAASRRRRRDDDLRAAPPRRRASCEARARPAHPRRGADDQERGQPARRGGARLERPPRSRLTGTPIENHLGELWSCSTSCCPGFLGAASSSRRALPQPIEQRPRRAAPRRWRARSARSSCAARRSRSRRSCRRRPSHRARSSSTGGSATSTKPAVAPRVGRQVRGRSPPGRRRVEIAILDALLKLRQVCCDPAPRHGDPRAASPIGQARRPAAS